MTPAPIVMEFAEDISPPVLEPPYIPHAEYKEPEISEDALLAGEY